MIEQEITIQLELMKVQISNLSKQVQILTQENNNLKHLVSTLEQKVVNIHNADFIKGIYVKHDGSYIAPYSVLTFDPNQKALIFKAPK